MSVLKSSFDQFHGIKRANSKWSPEEDLRLTELKASGASWEEISEEIGRPISGLSYRWGSLRREIEQ
jgi:hypothetical protein